MKLSISIMLWLTITLLTFPPLRASSIDVLHYRASIKADIPYKKIKGEINIQFIAPKELRVVASGQS